MAKSVLLCASLLLLCIAGGHGFPRIPTCGEALASCNADTLCATLYAGFEKVCGTERVSTPVNCTLECRLAIGRFISHPLGSSALFCDCGSSSPASDACIASRTNLNINCLYASSIPPGAPYRCGRPCLEARGRCLQNLTCALVVASIPAMCTEVLAWSGQGDLPACCSDCRDTLNMLHKLPNAMEVQCCDCEDIACEMFQMKIAAACPSRMSCQRDCTEEPTPAPPPPSPPPSQDCISFYFNCPRCRQLIDLQVNACKSVFDWGGQGTPPMCPEECAAVNRAFQTLPNVEELVCCDCGEGPLQMECTTRKMKIGAACGFGMECDGAMRTCPLDRDDDDDDEDDDNDDNDDNHDDDDGPPLMCLDIHARCPMHRELITKQLNACKPVLDWNGRGNPPMCPEACMNISRAIEDLPNAKRLACCDCGKGPQGMQCNMTKMKLGAACGVCQSEAFLC